MRLERFLMFCVIGLALTVEAAAEAPMPGQSDIARPGGVYASLNARDAAACAALCATDGLCLAWTFTPAGACGLTAIAAQPISSPGARSGLSSRAPEFARQIVYVAPPAPAPQLRLTPLAPPRLETAEASHYSIDDLLGGPDEVTGN